MQNQTTIRDHMPRLRCLDDNHPNWHKRFTPYQGVHETKPLVVIAGIVTILAIGLIAVYKQTLG